jgi:hypothetical protein
MDAQELFNKGKQGKIDSNYSFLGILNHVQNELIFGMEGVLILDWNVRK